MVEVVLQRRDCKLARSYCDASKIILFLVDKPLCKIANKTLYIRSHCIVQKNECNLQYPLNFYTHPPVRIIVYILISMLNEWLLKEEIEETKCGLCKKLLFSVFCKIDLKILSMQTNYVI